MVKFISRRQLLAGSLGTVAAACAADQIADDGAVSPTPTTASASPTVSPTEVPTPTPDPTATPEPAIELASDPFALGVASGAPLTDSVILWTRLVPDPTAEDGGMPDEPVTVTWEFMDDDAGKTLHSVEVMAVPEDAHSVHIEVSDLEPGTWYRYRFHAAGYTSPVGRTRTLPEGDVDQFTFAMASCQAIQFGEYAAWRDVAEQPDLDAVLFGGDYIYENIAFDLSPQRDEHRKWRTPPPSDLATFRLRYAQTKSDVHLQAAHAAVPWWIMWDDHELTDNYWREGGGMNDFAGGPLEPRRVAAYQAWWEHQPVRMDKPTDGKAIAHQQVTIGSLADLLLLDTRQHADVPPCRDLSSNDLGVACAERDDPDRTLLGVDQETWLDGAIDAASSAWTVLASPVMFAGLDARHDNTDVEEPTYYLESWDGYTASRIRVADALRAKPSPLVISADFHASFVLDVGPGFDADPVCAEFLATGISSNPFSGSRSDLNPHMRHHLADNGYVLHSVNAQMWRATFRTVVDIWDPDSVVETTAEYTVDAGARNAEPV